MICPVEIASDLSAWRAVRVADYGGHGELLEGRDGTGHESTGSNFASRGQEDHVVAGGGDHRHQRRCCVGGSATKSSFFADCSTGGGASRRRRRWRWRWW